MAAIWWIRRDLRISDNLTLQKALGHAPILPVFILDPLLLKKTPNRRKEFLFRSLTELNSNLKAKNSYLVIRHGKPAEVLEQLMVETQASHIFAEEDYTPYDRLRSVLVGGHLPLKLIQGQLGLHPLANLKSNGKPYTVYTPFRKNWQALMPELRLIPEPEKIPTIPGIRSEQIPEGKDDERFPPGEVGANNRLKDFMLTDIYKYGDNRDRLDFGGTSGLSPYFHLGILGLRTGYFHALNAIREADDEERSRESANTWYQELIWREFYIHILYHFPQVRTQNFRSGYDRIQWRNNKKDFIAWKQGRTGYPLVDAAMRQLYQTGWMPNRARMITASFLVKDLLIDWRWGESWFMENLIDGDLAANNGGWQWVAGTGTDAAPYFRIFNPVTQSRKFDPDGEYIRTWIPELADLGSPAIHAPWEKDLRIAGYPQPIVDHNLARERTLLAYRIARES
jgi:deoxyribodipyrimidine photo-lyase